MQQQHIEEERGSEEEDGVLVFYVNGEKVVERGVDPEITLLKYLRSSLHLTGCKLGCGEGGCGACTVLISGNNNNNNNSDNYKAINACLFPLPAVHQRHVLTIEGLKSKDSKDISGVMVETHASQCGFCTPGFVMSMAASVGGLGASVIEDVEDALAGNLCRCTGYRPIIEAYNLLLSETKTTNITTSLGSLSRTVMFKGPRVTWFTVGSLEQLLKLKAEYKEKAVIVNGNTEVGIDAKFKNIIPSVLLYPQWIKELNQIVLEEDCLRIGGVVTLQDLADYLSTETEKNETFQVLMEGLKWFAGRQIRNVATLAGNVATASPISDLNPILASLNAHLILTSQAGSRTISMRDFILGYRKTLLAPDELLTCILVPLVRKDEFAWTFKQSKRKEDDIAIVNCGIWCKRDLSQMRIALGGVDSFLRTFSLSKIKSREDIIQFLKEEIKMKSDVPGGMPEYRLALIKGTTQCFFSLIVGLVIKFFNALERNGEENEVVGRSFKVHSSIGSNIPHASASKHCSGQAQYVDDLPMHTNELYAVPVLSTNAHAKILNINTHAAQKAYPQVVFVGEGDVPGENVIGPIRTDEQVFYSRECTSVGQIILLVLADDQLVAQRAARLVQIEYEPLPFILTIEEAIREDSYHAHRQLFRKVEESSYKGAESVSGSVRIHGQEHFYLETQAAIVISQDDGEYYKVHASTQNPTEGQHFVAHVLGISQAQVQVNVKRLGGGFGGKETRASFLIAALSVAAYKTKRPVRCMLNRDQDMLFSGHRHTFLANYQAHFSKRGKILFLKVDLYSNGGHSLDLSLGVMERAMAHLDNAYYVPGGEVRGHVCRTNTPSNTAFRGFGAPQGMFVMEHILAHIAHTLHLDRETVQRTNLLSTGQLALIGQPVQDCTLSEMWDRLYREKYLSLSKKAAEFNQDKSGLYRQAVAMVPTKFGIAFGVRHLNQASALVHLQRDGSVLISHGGVEMGQGLHTKLVEVAAQAFRIPRALVKIKETSTATVANSSATAASASSDLYGRAVLDACTQLLNRLSKADCVNSVDEGVAWKERVNKAYLQRIDLTAHGFYKTPLDGFDWESGQGQMFSYFTYGVALSHIQLDLLTGDHVVLASHLLMDLGLPINAAIDLGQVEGAFLQGLGLFTREELLYNPKDGMLLTRGPGTYKIPSIQNVPRIFETELYNPSTKSDGTASSGISGLMGSKAVGEPPLFLAASVFFAIQRAVQEEQADVFICLDSPATPEAVKLALDQTQMLPGPRWGTRI